jgi:chromosome segregation ATPase
MVKAITLSAIAAQLEKMDARMEKGFAAVAEDIGDLGRDLKGDIDDLRHELKGNIGHLGEQLTSIEGELRDIKRRLAHLEESVAAVQGFAKEIDALSERVRAIEKHLGLNKKIAA